MAFDWIEYLQVAVELGGQEDNQAALRSAISRAYYAAFNEARQRLEGKKEFDALQNRDAGRGSHELIWRMYEQRGSRTNVQIGQWG